MEVGGVACESDYIRIRAAQRRAQLTLRSLSASATTNPPNLSIRIMPRPRPFRPLAVATNSQAKRNASPGPPSPTYSDTTNASAVHFGENGPAKIITRSDLKASMQSYENVSTHLRSPAECSYYLVLTPPRIAHALSLYAYSC